MMPTLMIQLGRANAVECARHERVVLHRVAEDYELGAAEPALCRGELFGFKHDAPICAPARTAGTFAMMPTLSSPVP